MCHYTNLLPYDSIIKMNWRSQWNTTLLRALHIIAELWTVIMSSCRWFIQYLITELFAVSQISCKVLTVGTSDVIVLPFPFFLQCCVDDFSSWIRWAFAVILVIHIIVASIGDRLQTILSHHSCSSKSRRQAGPTLLIWIEGVKYVHKWWIRQS